jgi:hypothetical protein
LRLPVVSYKHLQVHNCPETLVKNRGVRLLEKIGMSPTPNSSPYGTLATPLT